MIVDYIIIGLLALTIILLLVVLLNFTEFTGLEFMRLAIS